MSKGFLALIPYCLIWGFFSGYVPLHTPFLLLFYEHFTNRPLEHLIFIATYYMVIFNRDSRPYHRTQGNIVIESYSIT